VLLSSDESQQQHPLTSVDQAAALAGRRGDTVSVAPLLGAPGEHRFLTPRYLRSSDRSAAFPALEEM